MIATQAPPAPPCSAQHVQLAGWTLHDRRALLADLRAAESVPAVCVPGLEHQRAAAILSSGVPEILYQRQTLHRYLDEYLLLDGRERAGVLVTATWDLRAHRLRMRVAETGTPGVWDRVVAHFTQWEIAGRPVLDQGDPAEITP